MILPKFKLKVQLPAFFPHFFRRITALPFLHYLNYFFWLLLLASIPLNLYHSKIFGFTNLTKLRYELLEFPNNQHFHTELGNYYISQNQFDQAEKEYRLANDNILGTTTSPEDTNNNIRNKMQNLQDEIIIWQNISYNFPDYNFSYLKLATLYIALGKKDETKRYIDILLSHDPQNTWGLELKSLL